MRFVLLAAIPFPHFLHEYRCSDVITLQILHLAFCGILLYHRNNYRSKILTCCFSSGSLQENELIVSGRSVLIRFIISSSPRHSIATLFGEDTRQRRSPTVRFSHAFPAKACIYSCVRRRRAGAYCCEIISIVMRDSIYFVYSAEKCFHLRDCRREAGGKGENASNPARGTERRASE